MKAVIMAGGEGRRLRPVSGELPKPLVPLLGRSMLEHIIRLLRKNGFDEICMTLRYKSEQIIERFGDGQKFGVNICYRIENEPAGTAGGVKNCADFYGDDDFLVISGDAACDFDLHELMRQHKLRGADASAALYRHSEPLNYGLALTDKDDRIRVFIEKPDWSRVVTDKVNTGIYILSPAAMELVPYGKEFDFAKDLFPLMLKRGMKLIGLPADGYWCDVGTPLSYYKCCVDALEGRLNIDIPDGFSSTAACITVGSADDCTDEYPCRDKAALMGRLSEALLDMGADYSDGLHLETPRCSLHVAPSVSSSAIRIYTSSEDSEFAREFSLTTRELLRSLDEAQ